MEKNNKFSVFYIFLVYNEGDLKNIKIPEKELLSFYTGFLVETQTHHYLDLNTAEGYLIRNFEPEINDIIYGLTDKGVEKLSEIFNLEHQEEFPELNQFQSLHIAFIASNLPQSEKEAYDITIGEVITCIKNNCLNAAIAMSGKLLEIYLTELLIKNNVTIRWFQKGPKDTEGSFTQDLSLNQLLILGKERLLEDVKLVSLDVTQIELIKRYRNGAAHYNKLNIRPSKEMTLGIMQFVSHFLRHRLTWQ